MAERRTILLPKLSWGFRALFIDVVYTTLVISDIGQIIWHVVVDNSTYKKEYFSLVQIMLQS